VQLGELALGGKEDRADRRAGLAHLAEQRIEFRGAAGKRRVYKFVQRQVGGVGNHRCHIVDADLGAAVSVEHELANFAAGAGAVAAEKRDKQVARFWFKRQAGGAHFAVDETLQRRFVIGIAGHRRSILGALAHRPQRRGTAQVAGLNHDPALAFRQRQHRLDRGREVTSTGSNPYRAPATKQRYGLRLVQQAGGIGGDFVAVEPHQRKWIVRVVDRRADQRPDTLADEARILAEYENNTGKAIGLGKKRVGVAGFDRDHG
jgi:hypothetical protein